MTDPVASRSSYLQEAAHLLAISSPAASAFLGSARNRLIGDTESDVPAKEWDALRRESCGACGNLFVPGWSCEVSTTPKSQQVKSKGKSKASNPGASASMVYHCLRCRRKTEQPLQPPPRRQLKKSKAIATTQLPIIAGKLLIQEDTKTPKTANASSKQRQKSRKGGLQAMLEKNKSQTSKQGLDLMDFMM
jgi:DNA-directed RNA polymerase subunit RPC12/RpoP